MADKSLDLHKDFKNKETWRSCTSEME